MNKSGLGVSILFLALTCIAAAQQPNPTPITVDCSKGQSLNQALAKLNRQTPYTVSVNGTCTEFVQVIGFHSLVLKGLAGATLVQPSTGGGSLFNATLYIESSQSVQVEGFAFDRALPFVTGGVVAHEPLGGDVLRAALTYRFDFAE